MAGDEKTQREQQEREEAWRNAEEALRRAREAVRRAQESRPTDLTDLLLFEMEEVERTLYQLSRRIDELATAGIFGRVNAEFEREWYDLTQRLDLLQAATVPSGDVGVGLRTSDAVSTASAGFSRPAWNPRTGALGAPAELSWANQRRATSTTTRPGAAGPTSPWRFRWPVV